jgi:5-methylcytosine-specific restriction endonuclease McrA
MNGDKMNIVKEMTELKGKMLGLETEYLKLEEEMEQLSQRQKEEWVKTGECRICGVEGYTEWHHIISQHRCREEGLEHLISARTNVIELCKTCHDLTTASLLRKNMPDNTRVSEENEELEPTEKQIAYIKKLGGDPPTDLTRKGASQLIDELKKASE